MRRYPKRIRRIIHFNKQNGIVPVNKPIQRFFRMKPIGSDDYKRDYSNYGVITFNGLKHIGSSYFKIAKGRVVKVSRVRN